MKEKKRAVGAMVCLVVLALVITIVVLVVKQGNNTTTPTTPTTGTENNINNSSTNNTQKNELIYNSTDAFDYMEVEGGISIIEFKNYDYIEYDKIIIPSKIDGKTVVGIGNFDKDYNVFGAIFGSCEVVIPNTVTYIADMAFQEATGLVKLSGGENCKIIGEYAFMNCINLSEITFIDNVTDIADNAFAGCYFKTK